MRMSGVLIKSPLQVVIESEIHDMHPDHRLELNRLGAHWRRRLSIARDINVALARRHINNYESLIRIPTTC